MLNDITYEVSGVDALIRQRTVQPGGEFRLEPGERLLRVWQGGAEVDPDNRWIGIDVAADDSDALVLIARRVSRGLRERNEAEAIQSSLDGSAEVVVIPNTRFGDRADGPYGFIKWQLGPRAGGTNGTTIEDVIEVCIARLVGFQAGPFSSRENAAAIARLEEARNWLEQRARERERQGVLGANATHVDPLWSPSQASPMELVVRDERDPVVESPRG